jgi:hypothetical protein
MQLKGQVSGRRTYSSSQYWGYKVRLITRNLLKRMGSEEVKRVKNLI